MRKLARIVLISAIASAVLGSSGAQAAQCGNFGGWGTGALEGFASFMAEAAMKNSAKARLGTDSPKIGKVSTKCEVKTLLWECTASAKACK
jgi:hypothetical protein